MIGKISIKPTLHYLKYHSEIEWDLIILTILSPTKIKQNKRRGKNRFTYEKKFKKFIIEVHTKKDIDKIWIINAFKNELFKL